MNDFGDLFAPFFKGFPTPPVKVPHGPTLQALVDRKNSLVRVNGKQYRVMIEVERASGEVVCAVWGAAYKNHQRYAYPWDGYAVRACDGRYLHL